MVDPRSLSGDLPDRRAAAWRASILLAFVVGALAGCGRTGTAAADVHDAAAEPARFVGSAACGTCHTAEFTAWQGSHHEQAMQPATAKTVLGNFSDQMLVSSGLTTRMYRKHEEFWVETEGAGGARQSFRIAYTFGVHPLQQYLVQLDAGRLQALPVAWDSRRAAEGGQRWFSLQPDQRITASDPLHWTGPNFNWNSRCAECHSTGVSKGFDEHGSTFRSKWAEVSVGCEACHGPGSAHLEWAEARTQGKEGARKDKGLIGAALQPHLRWLRRPGDVTAHAVDRESSADSRERQLDVCGPCHSLRQVIATEDALRRLPKYADGYVLSLPTPPLYFPDGQIREEDYELGSFLQSKMHGQGVVCSNCHDPHSLSLRARGDAVCAQCHDPEVFERPTHHHHPAASSGARCVNCHMPTRTYMVIHARHDHSLRIPRPDQTLKFGTPNACNACHSQRSAAWAAAAVESWRSPSGKAPPAHFSDLLAADSATAWWQLSADRGAPPIARAAALARAVQNPDDAMLAQARRALADPSELVRRAAVGSYAAVAPEVREHDLLPLTSDPAKSVRIRVAQMLAPTHLPQQPPHVQQALAALFDEFVASMRATAEMPGAQVSLGLFYADRGDPIAAEAAYRKALAIDPQFIAGYLNLAELYRREKREPDALGALQAALKWWPDSAAVHHALGLQQLRLHADREALQHFRRAHDLEPGSSDYGYVYAVALFETGERRAATGLLKQLILAHPADDRLRHALIDYLYRQGRTKEGLEAAQGLLLQHPENAELRRWIDEQRRER